MWVYIWVDEPVQYLCFTANTAGSTVTLNKTWTPTTVTLETSTDWTNWSTYTFGSTITLSNIWDKVYWRNTSETATWFSSGTSDYYRFSMTWTIAASGDINTLLCKNSTDTLTSNYCFYSLFNSCSSLTTPPILSAKTITSGCYYWMFVLCSNLIWIPKLPATAMKSYCYYYMFRGCSKIKLSTTQTWDYTQEYRIPTTWTWSTSWASYWNSNMLDGTWGTYTWSVAINTTYYTSNTVV